jgi:hypothetical protein
MKVYFEQPREPACIISCTGHASEPGIIEFLMRCGANQVWTKPLPNFMDGTLQRLVGESLNSDRPSYRHPTILQQ